MFQVQKTAASVNVYELSHVIFLTYDVNVVSHLSETNVVRSIDLTRIIAVVLAVHG